MVHKTKIAKVGGHYRYVCSCGAFDIAKTKAAIEKKANKHEKEHN